MEDFYEFCQGLGGLTAEVLDVVASNKFAAPISISAEHVLFCELNPDWLWRSWAPARGLLKVESSQTCEFFSTNI